MVLTLSTSHDGAADLACLFSGHDRKARQFPTAVGTATVFWQPPTSSSATLCLTLDVDTIALTKRTARERRTVIETFVQARPFATSTLLRPVLHEILGPSMRGACTDPAVGDDPVPVDVVCPVVVIDAGAPSAEDLFGPVGYTMQQEPLPAAVATPTPLPPTCSSLRLRGHHRLTDLFRHLCILLPVLAEQPALGADDVDRFVADTTPWLAAHPECRAIVERSFGSDSDLTLRVFELIGRPDLAVPTMVDLAEERWQDRRLRMVRDVVTTTGARRVVDMGCGDGALVQMLVETTAVPDIIGVDSSLAALALARQRLRTDRYVERQRDRIQLLHGSILYADQRLRGADLVACLDLLQDIDPHRIDTLEQVLFGAMGARVVVMSAVVDRDADTRGMEDEVRFPATRAAFAAWCVGIADRYGYGVVMKQIGEPLSPAHDAHLAIFTASED